MDCCSIRRHLEGNAYLFASNGCSKSEGSKPDFHSVDELFEDISEFLSFVMPTLWGKFMKFPSSHF